ncbi:nitronate monooxygenase family protein [Nitratireductor sp. ZSWI3]|uniref:NAD(P)H-dependent flavin oxidoreductase n=1 Tax=Nitratireductor sp. ZSWI3 TaxID=2966359 RepID=UPI00214FBCB5|nr:nitronate monooxygenase family protein [Nitratireductor sp. ZSWI3]MCR4265269.1 nitronate monooxygenase family protein [Nitratireductor sp. ZSWI3]
MWTTATLRRAARLPVIGAPMFLTSGVDLVVAQCRAGIIGTFPALNARPQEELDRWLTRIEDGLARAEAETGRKPAPYGVNLIVHDSNPRLAEDLEVIAAHRVPLVITSLSQPGAVVERVHAYGGLVFHDVINVRHARKAAGAGVDGLILVCAGAGGHAGRLSPFALAAEVRQFFDGALALSGAISDGGAVAAAEAIGCDFAYVGTLFLAARESMASDAHKEMVVAGSAADVVYSPMFTGTHGNYLAASIAAAGIDPEEAAFARPRRMDFAQGASKPKAWKEIYGAGQGIGSIGEILPVGDIVERLDGERRAAIAALCAS